MPVPMLSVTSVSVDAVKPADAEADQNRYRVRARMTLTMPSKTPSEVHLRIDYLSKELPPFGAESLSVNVLHLLRDQIDELLVAYGRHLGLGARLV